MAKVCYKCGGLQPGCSVCDAPPRREKPFDRRQSPRLTLVDYGLITDEEAWPVQYIDLSGWNGEFDLSIAKTKCQALAIRLGYGNQWKDSRCDTYRRDAIANGMPYFGYWFNKAGQNWEAHAENFVEISHEFDGIIGLEEDFEYTEVSPSLTLTWIINLDTKIIQLRNDIKSTPYSNYNFWANKVAKNNYFLDEQWVANWTNGNAPYMPPNWTWKKGCKWQWSADGNGLAKEYGMIANGDNDIDLDRYYGTVEEFNVRYGTNILPIGQNPEPVNNFSMECIVDKLFVRNGPGTYYSIVGSLSKGQKVTVQNIAGNNSWIQIKDGEYADKWCAVQTSNRYMNPA